MESVSIKIFIQTVLDHLSQPYESDVIDRVFLAIEQNPAWLITYQELVQSFGVYQTKNSIASTVEDITGLHERGAVKASHSNLIENYTELR